MLNRTKNYQSLANIHVTDRPGLATQLCWQQVGQGSLSVELVGTRTDPYQSYSTPPYNRMYLGDPISGLIVNDGVTYDTSTQFTFPVL